MPEDKFDPKLKFAMAEIKTIIKKYDIAAAVTLVSKTHSEYFNHFPTWSVARLHGDAGLRIKCKREDFDSAEAQKEALTVSCHAILQMRDIGARTFLAMEHVHHQIEAFVDIEHKPFAGGEEAFRKLLFAVYDKSGEGE